MHKEGHRGIGLIILAAICYALLPERPILAALLSGFMFIQELPDKDQGISFLEHRGVSHSFLSIVFLGIICAGVGWAVGTFFFPPIASGLATMSSAGTPASWWGTRLATYDAQTMTFIGFAVGAGGIASHLLGDIITPWGLKPFLPFSKRSYRIARIPADSTYANYGLLILGFLAFGASIAAITGFL
ncbi:metal-dependent hydrolase [Halocatena halophila]|uniref:metal-dependent hydrolase n=1 Tax=Halocatena halophila TaxID=2814576 RepID=UPI002ED1A37C